MAADSIGRIATSYGEFRFERDMEDITSWQKFTPVYRIVTAERVYVDGELTPLDFDEATELIKDLGGNEWPQ